MALIFRKRLSRTDVSRRLSFPSKTLHHLPPFPEGLNQVTFRVKFGSERGRRELLCATRRTGYRKPVIIGGWAQIAQEKDLKVGDFLMFYHDKNHGHYRIEVKRSIRFWGQDVEVRVV